LIVVILSSIPTSIIIMSFLYGLTTLYSLAKDLKKRIWVDPSINQLKSDINSLPRIAILIPLYKEDRHSIEVTFTSLVNQIYPPDKLSVFIILENGDEDTKKYAEELKNILTNMKITVNMHVNNGKRVSKATAVNSILPKIINDYGAIMILDAGDKIQDQYYILKCADMIRKGYNIIGTKVYRVGENLIAKFSYIDTLLWYNISFPAIHSITRVPFLSGEGMVVSSHFIKRIGCLPEVLAEDSYTAMIGFIYGEKVGFINSVILEGAPSTFVSLFKQRLRWYRGGIECLKDFIMKYHRKVKLYVMARVCFAYLQTVALTAPFISLLIITLSLFIDIPSILVTLAKIEIVSIFLSPLALYFVNDVKDLSLFLAPMNWFLQSFIAFIALIPIKITWLRTSSRSNVNMVSYVTSIKRVQSKP